MATLLDTLAQSGTRVTSDNLQKPMIMVHGEGTDMGNAKALNGRAKRKIISTKMSLSLIDVAELHGDDKFIKSCWNTYHCQSRIHSSDGRLYGKYCKNKFCTLCCSIRKADFINRYHPIIKEWDDAHFVTLTVKAVQEERLEILIKKIQVGIRRIINTMKKRHQRGKGVKPVGVRSLECNFNTKKRTYNPHLHIIVANNQIAKVLIREWRILWTRKWVAKVAQHYRKVEDTERDLIEIIKYGSKIFTEPDVNEKSKSKDSSQIYVAALYNILKAMKGRRLFERFGFNLPPGQHKQSSLQVLGDYDEWKFSFVNSDWMKKQDGAVLTGYVITNELENLLENFVDNHLK